MKKETKNKEDNIVIEEKQVNIFDNDEHCPDCLSEDFSCNSMEDLDEDDYDTHDDYEQATLDMTDRTCYDCDTGWDLDDERAFTPLEKQEYEITFRFERENRIINATNQEEADRIAKDLAFNDSELEIAYVTKVDEPKLKSYEVTFDFGSISQMIEATSQENAENIANDLAYNDTDHDIRLDTEVSNIIIEVEGWRCENCNHDNRWDVKLGDHCDNCQKEIITQ